MVVAVVEELQRALRAGQLAEAFELLYGAYAADVKRFVRCSAPAAVRDDVCQDTWEAARAALPAYRFAALPRVWLLSIARRKAIDAHRGAERPVTLDSRTEHTPLAELVGLRRPETPSRELHLRQRSRVLAEALARLRPDERELLELRYVVGLKPAEIVRVLAADAPANTISQRIVRIVARLRSELAGLPELESYRARR